MLCQVIVLHLSRELFWTRNQHNVVIRSENGSVNRRFVHVECLPG